MDKELEFSSIEEIQKIALKSEKLREVMKEEMEYIDFENLESIQEYIDDYFEVFVYDGTLKIDGDLNIFQEGGIYYINGDFTVNGKLNTYGASTFYVNGNLTANEIIFCDNNIIIEKDAIAKDKIYFFDTSLGLEVKGKVETPVIYSSIETGTINIGSINRNTKGVIIKSSYNTMGDESFLKDLDINEITIDGNYIYK